MLKLVGLSVAKCGSTCMRKAAAFGSNFLPKRTLIYHDLTNPRKRLRGKSLEKLQAAGLTQQKYVEKLSEQFSEPNAAVLGQDVRILVSLAESKSDAQLAYTLLKRLQSQSGQKGAENPRVLASLNTLFMHMCHNLRQSELALQLYRDRVNSADVSRNMILVLLDLLYECDLHGHVLDVYEEQRRAQGRLWNHRLLFTVFASSCYRLGTAEALQRLHDEIQLVTKLSAQPVDYHDVCIAAALAIKLKQFDFVNLCAQYLGPENRRGLFMVLRVLTAVHLSDYEMLMKMLDYQIFPGRFVPTDVVNTLSSLVATLKAENNEAAQKTAALLDIRLKLLSEGGEVSHMSLEEHLLNRKRVIDSAASRHDAQGVDQPRSARPNYTPVAASEAMQYPMQYPSAPRTDSPKDPRSPLPRQPQTSFSPPQHPNQFPMSPPWAVSQSGFSAQPWPHFWPYQPPMWPYTPPYWPPASGFPQPQAPAWPAAPQTSFKRHPASPTQQSGQQQAASFRKARRSRGPQQAAPQRGSKSDEPRGDSSS